MIFPVVTSEVGKSEIFHPGAVVKSEIFPNTAVVVNFKENL